MAKQAIHWSGGVYDVLVDPPRTTIADLKRQLAELTGVNPKRQKLLGLVGMTKKTKGDDALTLLCDVLKPGKRRKIVMIGTRDETLQRMERVEAEAQAVAAAAVPPPVHHDDDGSNNNNEEAEEVFCRSVHEGKVAKRVSSYKPKMLNPPRDGKKCLVLDIDYTLFDHRSTAERPEQLRRPFLLEFLVAASQHYDIVIWSATSMRWIELKMQELGVSGHPDIYLVAFMDGSAMVTVDHPRYGVFNTKPLGVLWGLAPESCYNEANTIMFDDLRRNFVMNPQNGLKIRPCRDLLVSREDRELVGLTEYLSLIKGLDSFQGLDHRHWERYVARNHRREDGPSDLPAPPSSPPQPQTPPASP